MHAAAPSGDDPDGDGLRTVVELALGTSPGRADSDGDGYSDVEELLRGSGPTDRTSTPIALDAAVRVVPHLVGGKVHMATLVYIPDGDLAGKKLSFVTSNVNGLQPLPSGWMLGGKKAQFAPTFDGVGRVAVLDPVVKTSTVLALRGLSLGVVVTDGGTKIATTQSQLSVVQHRVYEFVQRRDAGLTAYEPESTLTPQGTRRVGLGGVYQPLIGGNNGNAALVDGQICAQSTVVTGVVNGVITQEVVEAECIDGDAFCAPGCLSTVGSRTRTIDPATLAGN